MRTRLTNADIAELLVLESDETFPPAQRALRRASRRAFLWEEEATALVDSRRPLTELSGVGPYIGRLIQKWIKNPPKIAAPPPIRSGFLTIAAASTILSHETDWLSGIKGDLQMHSVWSDGGSTIAQMAEAAMDRGYEYIAITDHSKGLKIARGIDEAQLERQGDEIGKVNAFFAASRKRFRVLRSIELNLNSQGEGDMSADSLNKLDIVLGCFHSSLRRTEDQTDRYLSALRNPSIQILGHPRGRVYNFRLGLTADWPRIFAEAANLDKAVEIDGYPDRQDLSPDLVQIAAEAGCRISLGTDSHGASQLRFMGFSAASALLGDVRRDRIVNFLSGENLLGWVDNARTLSKSRSRPASASHKLHSGPKSAALSKSLSRHSLKSQKRKSKRLSETSRRIN
jgi:histidinol phosphatase-like PHP family hydrolase